MPQKYIEVPAPVVLKNPDDGTPIRNDSGGFADPITFTDFIKKLMFNPKWSESYPNIKSADSICKAVEYGLKDGVIILAEEDWLRLDDAARNPRQAVLVGGNMTVQSGYGYHPRITMQLLPLIEAVVAAKNEPPAKPVLVSMPAEALAEPSEEAAG